MSDSESNQLSNIEIMLNGAPRNLQEPVNVATLLSQMQLDGMRLAVEVDGSIVPRSQYVNRLLENGAVVEVITAVGGG